MSTGECVQVMVRCRPMNQREKNNGSEVCVEVDKTVNQIIIRPPGANKEEKERAFTYDAVFDWNSEQRGVYDEGAFSLVESVMNGYNGTIFAYGQTGCGKTHTMIGVKGDKNQRGIIPNAFDHIFGYLDDAQNQQKKFLIRCSYLEIYNEQIRDLLAKDVEKKLDLKEDKDKGVFVKDLTTCIVKSIPEIEAYMEHGTNQRKTGETAMNKDSSRSHSIFTIYVETAQADESGEQRIKAGKLNLVDLAGSERQSKTQATGARLKEATQINLSLSALGNVISALVEGKSGHIPYRDSKLTRLLQDSLGGNTKTVMIAAISPADFNFDETFTTLRYASRAKNIKNKPRVNQDPKDALLKQYEEEIQKLKAIIEASQKGGKNISNVDLGQSLKMIGKDQNLHSQKEESVDELLSKLAKKGKKVKLLDESASVKELPRQEDLDDGEEDLERDEREPQEEIDEEMADDVDGSPSKVKKKIEKIKQDREESDEMSAQRLLEQQQQQQQIIEQTNQQLQEEANKRAELQRVLQEMEQRMVIGGNVLEEKEREAAQEQRKLQLDLEQEKEKQRRLLEEKERQEAELLEKEQNYNSLQEEVEDCRKIIKKLRQKYKGVTMELKDIHQENAEKNEELLDTVREQAKELDFLNQMIGNLMTDEQIYKIKEKTEWDDEKRKWRLPAFVIKSKEIQLPKLGGMNTKQFIQEELENQEVQFQNTHYSDPDGMHQGGTPYQNQVSAQRKTNGFRNDSRKANHRMDGTPYGMNGLGSASNAYIQSADMNGGMKNQARAQDFKMSRNESKSSANFSKDQIRNQQNRIMRINNENYIMESPDIGHRKLNNKAGVTLAPLGQAQNMGAGRSSMMSIKGMENETEGTESHPILRVHNYKKPQLEKLNHTGQGAQQSAQKGITFNMDGIEQSQNMNNGKIQMTFQATVSIDQNQQQNMVLNSKKIVGRKRDNAQLAPLNHPPSMMGGNVSQMSNQR